MARIPNAKWRTRWLKASANNPAFARSREAKAKENAKSKLNNKVKKAMKEAKFE